MPAPTQKAPYAPPLIISAVGLALCWISWRRWPDVLIDYGRELYVPWRLAEGDVLYRDVGWIYGPLSPYFNAVLFKLFGTSLTVLALSNLVLTAILTAVIYRMFVQWTSRWVATVCCVTFLCLFAFAHLQQVGNYNFICPYSHSLTHGIFLSLVGMLALGRFLQTRGRGWLVCHSLCFGLILLSKLEVFVAFACAATVGWAVFFWRDRPGARIATRSAALGGACFVLPAFLFTLLLWRSLPLAEALHGVFFSWVSLFSTSVAETHFHRLLMGTDRLLVSAGQVLAIAAVYVVALAALYGLNRLTVPLSADLRRIAAVVVALGVAIALWQLDRRLWLHLFRPLPLFVLGVALWLVIRVRRDRGSRPAPDSTAALLMFSTFAFALLLKILFRVRLDAYGFALAMPATLLVVVMILDWLPRWLRRRSAQALLAELVLWSVFACTFTWYVKTTVTHYIHKTDAFARGADHMLIESPERSSRSAALLEAAEFIEQHFRQQDEFVVFPEGVMLNYVTRRSSPIPYYSFDPSIVDLYGEEAMLAALQEHPPDYVIICSREMIEFGTRFFGQDNAERISQWIYAHYEPVEQIGRWPPESGRFGLVIMKRSTEM